MNDRNVSGSLLFLLVFTLVLSVSNSSAEEKVTCKSLDIREFGLVSDGEIIEPWSEGQLIGKYGPPCQIIDLGDVYIERNRGRIVELGAKTLQHENLKSGASAFKKQFIYSGDDSNKTSIFTILDGLVVKKERIF